MKNEKIFSFDAETDGLWGNPFAIAAIVYEKVGKKKSLQQCMPTAWSTAQNGYYEYAQEVYESQPNTEWVETARFIARLSDTAVTNPWVIENVLPTLANINPTHKTYESMLSDFANFYKAHKADADCICHMGYSVEAHLLREMRRLEFIGDWDAPYPLHDVSGNLQQVGEDPTSVDGYATKHNPLYDCEVAAKVYMHLMK